MVISGTKLKIGIKKVNNMSKRSINGKIILDDRILESYLITENGKNIKIIPERTTHCLKAD
jgi:hypothetical protein